MQQRSFAVVAAVVVLAAVLGARQTSPLALSSLDYYEIKQLHARFSHGLDTAADGGALLASVFTADGVLVDESGRTAQGREQLTAVARNNPLAGPTNVGHYVTNIDVQPVPGGAIGRSDVMTGHREAGQPRGTFTLGGEYWDVFVRTNDGWRIARREFRRVGSNAGPAPMPSATASASRPAPKPGALTVADYADIEQLYARYSHGFDSAADRGNMWANLFTTDGFHRNYPNQYIKGHQALAEFAYDERGNQAGVKTPLSALHFITNVMLEPIPGGVLSKAYLMYVRRGADGEAIAIYPGGTYWDVLVKTPQGWRYIEKNVIMANLPVPDPAKRLQSPSTASAR